MAEVESATEVQDVGHGWRIRVALKGSDNLRFMGAMGNATLFLALPGQWEHRIWAEQAEVHGTI